MGYWRWIGRLRGEGREELGELEAGSRGGGGRRECRDWDVECLELLEFLIFTNSVFLKKVGSAILPSKTSRVSLKVKVKV